jgi:outer membrane lipoprotein LolB
VTGTPPLALAATLIAVLLVAGCRTAPTRPVTAEPWNERRTALQGQEHFEAKGRVAVAAGSEGFNARIRWEQEGVRSLVALDGPLGVGGVRVASDGDTFSISTTDGQQLDSEAARAELTSRLGFDPPLSSLRFWILGVPDPSQPASETLDEQQRLAALEQNGWRIDYANYKPVAGRWLPERLTLRRGDVRVRLIVDRWSS